MSRHPFHCYVCTIYHHGAGIAIPITLRNQVTVSNHNMLRDHSKKGNLMDTLTGLHETVPSRQNLKIGVTALCSFYTDKMSCCCYCGAVQLLAYTNVTTLHMCISDDRITYTVLLKFVLDVDNALPALKQSNNWKFTLTF